MRTDPWHPLARLHASVGGASQTLEKRASPLACFLPAVLAVFASRTIEKACKPPCMHSCRDVAPLGVGGSQNHLHVHTTTDNRTKNTCKPPCTFFSRDARQNARNTPRNTCKPLARFSSVRDETNEIRASMQGGVRPLPPHMLEENETRQRWHSHPPAPRILLRTHHERHAMPTAKRRTQKATRPPATPTARTHQLQHRLICPRHRWPEAHDILRREQQPAELSSTPTRDVLIRTTHHAADQLRRICTPAPSRTPTWKPHDEPTERKKRDALDELWERTFSRYRAARAARDTPPDPQDHERDPACP